MNNVEIFHCNDISNLVEKNNFKSQIRSWFKDGNVAMSQQMSTSQVGTEKGKLVTSCTLMIFYKSTSLY